MQNLQERLVNFYPSLEIKVQQKENIRTIQIKNKKEQIFKLQYDTNIFKSIEEEWSNTKYIYKISELNINRD